jgi:hypothetical protein
MPELTFFKKSCQSTIQIQLAATWNTKYQNIKKILLGKIDIFD